MIDKSVVKKRTLVALTQGHEQPGRRFRWRQYLPELCAGGFEVFESESRYGAYAPEGSLLRFPWLVGSVSDGLRRVINAQSADLIFLQRNLTATLATWEWLIRPPFVFDVDDAIFLGSRGGSAGRIAKRATLTICGNDFLAEYFSQFGPVAILPTAVDTAEFRPAIRTSGRTVIGWSGSSSGFEYLYAIEGALRVVLDRFPDSVLKVVSDKRPTFSLIDSGRVEFERWTAERQVASLQEFTVGLMPLTDTPWSRGKCSYKMLTYMAVGVPVVVSPVGMNVQVLSFGESGFSASDDDDWIGAISALVCDADLVARMGSTGRKVVEAHYSKRVLGSQLVDLLHQQL